MNRTEMIEQISQETSLPKGDVTKVLTAFCDMVKSTLKTKKDVRLTGFGTFSLNERKARTGRNPKTGQSIQIPAATYPKFKPGKEFKDCLN